MSIRNQGCWVAALGVILASGAGRAQAGLVNTVVSGTMTIPILTNTNYFNPANGFVPGGYLNAAGTTVTIAEPAIEFGYKDLSNTDTANFTNTQLIVTDTVATVGYNSGVIMTFPDPAFLGLTLVSNDFPTGLTGSISGDVISITTTGGEVSVGTYTAVFNVASPATVPEPSSLVLSGIAGLAGLCSAAALARRKQTSN